MIAAFITRHGALQALAAHGRTLPASPDLTAVLDAADQWRPGKPPLHGGFDADRAMMRLGSESPAGKLARLMDRVTSYHQITDRGAVEEARAYLTSGIGR